MVLILSFSGTIPVVLKQNVKSHINNFVHQNHMTQDNVKILEREIEQLLEGREIKIKIKSKLSNKKSRTVRRDQFMTTRETEVGQIPA